MGDCTDCSKVTPVIVALRLVLLSTVQTNDGRIIEVCFDPTWMSVVVHLDRYKRSGTRTDNWQRLHSRATRA